MSISKAQLTLLLAKLYHCHLWQAHDWTCAAREGIPATPEQIANGVEGFYDYARMYCKRCGKESEISRLARERSKHE